MIHETLKSKYWNGTATPEENVIFFELMTKEEMNSEYDFTMKALSTESVFSVMDARGRANVLMDCWNQVHNLHGWYDIFEDNDITPFPIRYVSKEKYEGLKKTVL